MTAKEVLRTAIFETYSVEEIKDGPKVVMLQDIDKKYWNFVIKTEFKDYGKVFYFLSTLFVVTEKTFPDVVPLITVSNIGYSPEEMLNEMANVIGRNLNMVG